MNTKSACAVLLCGLWISTFASATEQFSGTVPCVIDGGVAVVQQTEYLDTKIISLNGTWRFFRNELISTAAAGTGVPLFVTVPDLWNKYVSPDSVTSRGYGTYVMKITNLHPYTAYAILMRESPGTSCRIFGNGLELCAAGTVSAVSDHIEPGVMPLFAEVKSNVTGEVELAVQVANKVHRKGGFWGNCSFGSERVVARHYDRLTGVSWFVIGTMSFLIIFTLSSFLLAPSQRQNIWFSLFVLALMIRTSISGFSVLTLFIPNIPLGLQLKLEYFGIWFCPPAFLMMLYRTYPDITAGRKIRTLLITVSLIIGCIATCLPIRYANQFVPVMEMAALLCLLYVIAFLILALKKHIRTVIMHMATVVILGALLITNLWFALSTGVIYDEHLPIVLLVFTVLQFLLLSYRQSKMYQERITLMEDMRRLNNAYLRFVPREFLMLLKKRTMTDVFPGDYVEKKMSITFTQIQFEKIDGTELSPEEQYTLFCACLRELSPVISLYNGFISKFISHGFMALFPYSPLDAVRCCLEIESRITAIGQKQRVSFLAVRQGTGIHYGKMILGTIGEENRLDDTVISDTVNTASRIEAVSESKQKPVVISHEVYDEIKESLSDTVEIEPLGTLTVKGKSKALPLFSVCRSIAALLFFVCALCRPLNAQEFRVNAPQTLERKTVAVDGPWEFFPNEFIMPGDTAAKPCMSVSIPQDWIEYHAAGMPCNGQGAASYRIRVVNLKPLTDYAFSIYDKAATAMTVYINGKQVAAAGVPALDWTKTVADQQMGVAFFAADEQGTAEIIIHVSNDFYRIGGIWRSILIGEKAFVMRQFSHKLRSVSWFIGALAIVIMYQLSLFVFVKKNRSALYLALFALSIMMRLMSAGFSIIKVIIPLFPYSLLLKTEYTALFAAPLFFALYMYHRNPHTLPRLAVKIIVICGSCIAAVVYFLPIYVACRMVRISQIYSAVVALYLVAMLLYRYIKTRRPVTGFTLISVLLLPLGSLHDMLALSLVPVFLPDTDILPYTFVLFVFFQTIITAYQHERSRTAIEKISDRLAKTNKAYYRFVPREFLALLSKKNIVDVTLGESVVKNVTMLCADIRNFTAISESIDGEKVFQLLNKYLMRIAPIIRTHNGFIEKYLGDGIIALFPGNGTDCFACALEMQSEIVALQKLLALDSLPNIEIGIGIHYGKIVLGTVGEEERMNEVSISKTVETVLTMESLTKQYKHPILATGTAVAQWKNFSVFFARELDSELAERCGVYDDIYAIEAPDSIGEV